MCCCMSRYNRTKSADYFYGSTRVLLSYFPDYLQFISFETRTVEYRQKTSFENIFKTSKGYCSQKTKIDLNSVGNY